MFVDVYGCLWMSQGRFQVSLTPTSKHSSWPGQQAQPASFVALTARRPQFALPQFFLTMGCGFGRGSTPTLAVQRCSFRLPVRTTTVQTYRAGQTAMPQAASNTRPEEAPCVTITPGARVSRESRLGSSPQALVISTSAQSAPAMLLSGRSRFH